MTEKYFAAANSAGGFVCWFDEIFSPDSLDKIYIIKGGSGTGKSTLMKKIAAKGTEAGYDCELFYCSSDPLSLDGIILHSCDGKGRYKSIAVVDGTAPHTRDPKLPGAAEELINLGEYWQTDVLREHRSTIAKLCAKKSDLFTQAYEYLYAAGEIEGLLRSDAARFILADKLKSAAERLLGQLIKDARLGKRRTPPKVKTRAVSAISSEGLVSFDTYRNLPGKVYAVADVMGCAPFMFDALIDTAKRLGLEIIRAPMPLKPELTEAIRFPDLNVSVVLADTEIPSDAKIINMARFIDRDAILPGDKQRRRLLSKCSAELVDGALSKLAGVKDIHGEVEKIYIAAMNFSHVDLYLGELLAKLF